MVYVLTEDVCQPIVSGQPIRNNGNFCYVNELVGVTGVYKNELTYAQAVSLTEGQETKLTERFDDPDYYSV